jgi:beta-galactosidase
MMKKRAIIVALFLVTVLFFGVIGSRGQQGDRANYAAIQITSDFSQESNSKRGQIFLNGVWKFIPVDAASEQQPPQQGWGSILVPGDWQRENDKSRPGLIARGKGKAWQNFNGEKLAKAWYQRSIKIPQEWQGRSLFLDIGRVSTDAVVYVNGIKCAEINFPYGAADITKAVKPGEEATLTIMVAAVADEKKKTIIMGPNESYTTEANLDSRGLIGEVRLLSMPKGPHISDVFIQPSTRNKQIKLDVELTGVKQAGAAKFVMKMLDETGSVERQFTATNNVKAKPIQTLEFVAEWPTPRLWDVGQPNLYTLQLEVEGSGIEDEYNQRFGFREFWIEGRKFYLNGKELRLRPTSFDETWQGWAVGIPEVVDRMIDGYFWAGFNIAEMWPWNRDERGKWHFQEIFTERADLKGFPLMAPALYMANIASNKAWNVSSKQKWEARMATDLRRYRNHPSILLWASSPNFFGHSDDQNPLRIGKKKIEGSINRVEDKRMREIIPIGEEAVATIKKYDPTRPVMMHQGPAVGDVYALNSYLNMIPLQEREEWLSEWSKRGDMPYMVVEFGTPLHTTMMRSRNGFRGAIASEPLMTEFSAIYLGSQAYKLETPAYRAKIRDLFVKDQEYKSWHGDRDLDFSPGFQKLQQLFSTNTWRSWRTFGLSGGLIPWNNGHGWEHSSEGKERMDSRISSPEGRGVYLKQIPKSLWYNLQPEANIIHPGGQAIMQNNRPTLAWIAGSKEAFTAKDHSFNVGQKLQKQVVLINDTRSKQEFSFEWQVIVNGQQLATGQKKGNMETAQTLFFPIEANLPNSTVPSPQKKVEKKIAECVQTSLNKADCNGKRLTSKKQNSKSDPPIKKAGVKNPKSKIQNPKSIDGEIRLLAKIGNQQHQDKFAFRVFPKLSKAAGSITVFDPVGKTTRMLQQLGYSVVPWDGSTTPLLVIGREALSSNGKVPGNLAEFVSKGGRVIVFAQNPEWMQQLGLRVANNLTRRVFPINNSHPIFSGLDELDLRDWNGESTLVEAYPDTVKKASKRSPHGTPWYGWHWGNRGAVSSASIEKPHRSSWRPILESEFDLAYTPLMELDYGKGRLILNTLDLEDYVSRDPVAGKLAKQIINYAANSPLSTKADQVILIGDDTDKAKLDALGVIYQQSTSLENDADLTIIGTGGNVKDEDLQAYLKGGGKLFFLPRSSPLNVLGVRFQQVKNFAGSLSIPKWSEAKGISASDLHSRTDYNAWLIESGGEVASNGLFSRINLDKGVAIFCQIAPDNLKADDKTYFRYTRWRETRILAQLLANLGASFKTDEVIFNHQQKGNWFAKSAPRAEFYHSDYRTDFDLGDDPYRYYRW